MKVRMQVAKSIEVKFREECLRTLLELQNSLMIHMGQEHMLNLQAKIMQALQGEPGPADQFRNKKSDDVTFSVWEPSQSVSVLELSTINQRSRSADRSAGLRGIRQGASAPPLLRNVKEENDLKASFQLED
jgi:hypothetical protein